MRPIIASLVGVLLLFACFAPVALAQDAKDCTTEGCIRIINVSPDVGGVDVLVNGQIVQTNVAGGAVTGFANVGSGTISVEVRQTGKTTAVIPATNVTLGPGGCVTLAVTGRLTGAGQQPTPSLALTNFVEDLTAPAAGQARVRFISLADVGAVDVLVNNQPIATNVAVGAAATAVDLPAGKVTIRVVKTGTTENIIGPTDVDLVAGRSVTIFSSGVAADNTLTTILAPIRSFDAQARFVHASPNAPAIDILVNGQPIVSNLAFPNATPFIALPSGGVCVVVAPTGQTTPSLTPLSLNLESGSKSTVLISGLQGGTPALSVVSLSDTTTAPAAGMAKIRVIHASPDAGPIDVLEGDTKLVSNLEFGKAGDSADLTAAAHKVKINKAGTTETILPEVEIVLSAGQIVTLVVRGTLSDKTLGLTILTDISGG